MSHQRKKILSFQRPIFALDYDAEIRSELPITVFEKKSFYFRPDEVKALFGQFGHVRDVHIPIDFNTRQPRGFAYIE